MSKKWKFWLRVAVASTLFGVVLALLQLCLVIRTELDDYTLPGVIRFSAGLALLCFVSAIGLVFASWALSSFFRWLFTWRIIKRCLWALLILASLVPVFYAEENWRGQRAWENYRHELEAKGEKLDFADYLPPRVPDEQNFAFAPVVRTTWCWQLDTNGHKLPQEDTNIVRRLDLNLFRTIQLPPPPPQNWQSGKTTDLAAWQNYFRTMFVTNRSMGGMPGMPPGSPEEFQSWMKTNSFNPYDTNEVIEVEALATNEFPVAAQPQSPAADVLLALSKFDPALAELREAADRPLSHFPLDYETQPTYMMVSPHLESLKKTAEVLRLRAVALLADGQTSKAFDDVKLIFKLGDSIQAEPGEISPLVYQAIIKMTMSVIWEGMMAHRWTDAQLSAIQSQIEVIDLRVNYRRYIRSERARVLSDIDWMMQKQNLLEFRKQFYFDDNQYAGDFWDRVRQAIFFYSLPRGWLELNKLGVARIFQSSLQTEDEVGHGILCSNVAARYENVLVREVELRTARNFLVGMFMPAPSVKTFSQSQACLDLATIACARERYWLAEGAYPETLDALSPRFLEKIPRDVINGQPLHYRRTEDGKFLLYSVGWNETDDGGQPGLGERGNYLPAKGDWVWMFPPT